MKTFRFIIKTDTNIYTEETYKTKDITSALLMFTNTSVYDVKDIKYIITI